MEPPALHGRAPGPRAVGHRRTGGGGPDRRHALADGRGGITTRITAQYVLGYLALGRADWDTATGLLSEALALGEPMAELQRLSPPLWGLAEIARCQGDDGRRDQARASGATAPRPTSTTRPTCSRSCSPACGRGLRGVDVGAAELARPGRRDAHRPGDPRHAARARPRPRTDPARRRRPRRRARRPGQARTAWRARRRFWEGGWARLDLAAAAARARRRGEAAAARPTEAGAAAAARRGARRCGRQSGRLRPGRRRRRGTR